MRLICPNCDAEYEVPEGMVPAAGRYVQCTACHTRWFARGEAAAAPSEDQIVARLETRALRPANAAPASEEPAAPEPAAEAPEPPSPVVPIRPVGPPKPSGEPTVLRPGPLAPPVEPLRPAPRLDLAPAPRSAPAPEPAPSPGRFLAGLALPLLLLLLALGAYDFRDDIAATLPAAEPALDAYAGAVDDLRAGVERRLAPLRARVAEEG